MRVGGPYKLTASLSGFNEEQRNGIMLSLGVTLDLDISLSVAAVTVDRAVFRDSRQRRLHPEMLSLCYTFN